MKKNKVLIIEDNQELVEMYNLKLQKCGFDSIIAFDGEQGLQKVIDEKPDLVLLDVLMPNMNGFEVLQVIKENTSINVPIILLTNLSQQQQIEQGYKLGATTYLVKANYTPAEVVEKIKEYLQRNEEKSLVELTPNHYDYADFVKNLPEPIKAKTCPECFGHIVMELMPNREKEQGTWFEAHFICTECGLVF